jgi:predicted alpha/beta hydrolase family esterase
MISFLKKTTLVAAIMAAPATVAAANAQSHDLTDAVQTAPANPSAKPAPAPQGTPTCPMRQSMMAMGGMQRDMSAMMTDMSTMMNSTNDPSMKARMQKMRDQMAGMMTNMQKMGGMMCGAMMEGGPNAGSIPSVAPPTAPEDHKGHHPNQ